MGWGIGWGLLIIGLLFAFFGYAIFQEARTHRFWRRKVQEGDLEMIRQLVQVEVERWRTERPPKGMAAAVWQGIQGVEIVTIGREYLRVSTTAEPQFALVGDARRQVSSAVDEAKRITARLAERLFYDIPHVRVDRVQIDVYTTFHETGQEASQRCIMSTVAQRDVAADLDWDDDPPEVIAERLGARYQLDSKGAAMPIEPAEEEPPAAVNGAQTDGPETVA